MKYAIDNIINNIVTAENINTKEKIILKIEDIPFQVKEGTIIIIEDNIIKQDIKEEQKRRKRIQEKLNELKKENNEKK